MAKVMVLGCGFGSALAVMAHRQGHDVSLWSKFPAELDEIARDGEQKRLLPGVPIPRDIRLTKQLEDIKEQELVILALPSFSVRENAALMRPHVKSETILLNVAKGLEEHSANRLSQVIAEELPENPVAVMSGPCHAEELGRGLPTTEVIAAERRSVAEQVQELLMGPNLRLYVSDDLIGVELGAALKNVIALTAGVVDGLALGDNAKAALITRGITEIARLGTAMGAKTETFAGLSGIGDLIVTCTSMHSRNRRAGILIGQGVPAAEAVKQIGTVEGYFAAKIAYELCMQKQVVMPITEQVYEVLYRGKSPQDALRDLMQRPKRHESESIWLQQG